jgi:hypothetical protein
MVRSSYAHHYKVFHLEYCLSSFGKGQIIRYQSLPVWIDQDGKTFVFRNSFRNLPCGSYFLAISRNSGSLV